MTASLAGNEDYKDSLEDVVLRVHDFDNSVKSIHCQEIIPENPYIKATKEMSAKIAWTFSIIVSSYVVAASFYLLIHYWSKVPIVSRVFVVIYLVLDFLTRSIFTVLVFEEVLDCDLDELFIAIPALIATAFGKEDFLFHLVSDIDELNADAFDVYTMLTTMLLIPFLALILRDPVCIEDTLLRWLTTGLIAGACFVVAKQFMIFK
ncbi:12716_t:CDS:2 [Ambispora gerdemannii]|uniref:12716_t:CDS:1 n=1 Tax=Ambispora gerdemannii TaxID=144530 RepID=A0A9N9D6N6_9GLOM|nr:12716_t:CDS:2 [Ambispora gerdemannii]